MCNRDFQTWQRCTKIMYLWNCILPNSTAYTFLLKKNTNNSPRQRIHFAASRMPIKTMSNLT